MIGGKKVSVSVTSTVQPMDVLAGLGSADRTLLAAGLALFEETTLQRRVHELAARGATKSREWLDSVAGQKASAASAEQVRSHMSKWQESALPDDQLRLLLWMYLREAFRLPPRLCISMRSAGTACDDLSAAALHFVGPGIWQRWLDKVGVKPKSQQPDCLDELVRPILDQLLQSIFKNIDELDPAARAQLIAGARDRLEEMTEADREKLLREIKADELNDAAIIKILATAGGMTAFSTAVGFAGFSAYILAAQASAFIPLLSGPALVSLVAVLSNPITVVGATLGAGWWAAKSANERVRAEVGVRVMSLLALQGLSATQLGLRSMLDAFTGVAALSTHGDLNAKVLALYVAEWRALESAVGDRTPLDPLIEAQMNTPVDGNASKSGRLGKVFGIDQSEFERTKVIAGLTFGDIAYSAASINPAVLHAADFARTADLSDPLEFAAFARKIMEMDVSANLGAISDLKGYVAEQMVAAQLIAQGYQVEFPAASNQEGWDISVDGIHFQVKDSADLGHIATHFGRFEFPVIANAEVAEMLAAKTPDALPEWSQDVYFVEGYNDELITQVTTHSIEAADGMFHPHVPLFAIGISAYHNISRMRSGEVTGAQAVQQVALDGSTRAGLAAAGGFAGNAIGFLVFGPAGALVMSGALPILAQTQSKRIQGLLDRHLTSDEYKNWAGKAQEALLALSKVLLRAIAQKITYLRRRLDALPSGALGDYVGFRISDDMRFLRETRCKLERLLAETDGVENVATRMYQWLPTSTIHPRSYQNELKQFSETLQQRPTATQRAVQQVQRAKNTAQRVGWKSLDYLRKKLADKN